MLLKYFFLYFLLTIVNGKLDFAGFKNFITSLGDDTDNVILMPKKIEQLEVKPNCDENRLMLYLARLYIVSPERIMLLVTSDSIIDMCEHVGATIEKVTYEFQSCQELTPEHLYMKLFNAVKNFYKNFCQDNDSRHKKIVEYHACLQELHEDYLDCEGPIDWFESTNKTTTCKILLEILNCIYMKTAELCGLDIAFIMRAASIDVFNPVLPYKCILPRELPKIINSMSSDVIVLRYLTYEILFFLLIFLCISGTIWLCICKFCCKKKSTNVKQ